MLAIVDGIGINEEEGCNGSIIVVLAVMAVLASLAAYQIGPRPVKKDFQRRK